MMFSVKDFFSKCDQIRRELVKGQVSTKAVSNIKSLANKISVSSFILI